MTPMHADRDRSEQPQQRTGLPEHLDALNAEVERLTEINRELVETHNVYLGITAGLEAEVERLRAEVRRLTNEIDSNADIKVAVESRLLLRAEAAEAENARLRAGMRALVADLKHRPQTQGMAHYSEIEALVEPGVTERTPIVMCRNPEPHAPHWKVVEAGGIVYAQGRCAGLSEPEQIHVGSLMSGEITCSCGWTSGHHVLASEADEAFDIHLREQAKANQEPTGG